MARMGPEAQSLQDPIPLRTQASKGKEEKGKKGRSTAEIKRARSTAWRRTRPDPFSRSPTKHTQGPARAFFPPPKLQALKEAGEGAEGTTLTRRAIHHNGRRHLFCLGSLGRSVGHHRHQHHPPTPDTRELGQPGPGRTDRAELTCVRHCRCGHDDGTLLVLSANKHKHKKKIPPRTDVAPRSFSGSAAPVGRFRRRIGNVWDSG